MVGGGSSDGGDDDVVGGDGKRKVGCGDKVGDDDGNDDGNVGVDDDVGVDINDGNNANLDDSMRKTESDHNCSLICVFPKKFWRSTCIIIKILAQPTSKKMRILQIKMRVYT